MTSLIFRFGHCLSNLRHSLPSLGCAFWLTPTLYFFSLLCLQRYLPDNRTEKLVPPFFSNDTEPGLISVYLNFVKQKSVAIAAAGGRKCLQTGHDRTAPRQAQTSYQSAFSMR